MGYSTNVKKKSSGGVLLKGYFEKSRKIFKKTTAM